MIESGLHESRARRVEPITNRVTELLGVDFPIVQAPMGWIARSSLASAVSAAGGMGMIETSSGELGVIEGEIEQMARLTDRPFGVNLALRFLRDPSFVESLAGRTRFVTTSAGDPTRYTARLKDAGLVVFHVVPTLLAARKAVDAGVDGLVVEGGEGGGFKHATPVATTVLLPLVAQSVDVPVIAAGGLADGSSMAAAFAAGAEGIQMGTRMLASRESPVHRRWKGAILAARETDTVLLNRGSSPTLRALRTETTEAMQCEPQLDLVEAFRSVAALYFGGDMEAAVPLTGEVAGRITRIDSVQEIIESTVVEFRRVVARLAAAYV